MHLFFFCQGEVATVLALAETVANRPRRSRCRPDAWPTMVSTCSAPTLRRRLIHLDVHIHASAIQPAYRAQRSGGTNANAVEAASSSSTRTCQLARVHVRMEMARENSARPPGSAQINYPSHHPTHRDSVVVFNLYHGSNSPASEYIRISGNLIVACCGYSE